MSKREKWKLINIRPGDKVEFKDKHMTSPETAKVERVGKHMVWLILEFYFISWLNIKQLPFLSLRHDEPSFKFSIYIFL